jgi:LysM repeat protein
VSAAAILAANPSLQNNPALIFPGQQLVIPVSSAPVPTAVPVTGGIIITVQPGENLATYVTKYKVSASAILAANPSLQNNPALIFPGQQLVIPVSSSAVPSATPLPNTAGFLRITVQPGESLITYVNKYKVTASAIIALNPSIQANPALLQPGQVLIIPVPANSTPAGPTPTATFPPAATVVPSGTPKPVGPTPITGNFIVITVRQGDSLLTYVTRYGVSGSGILALNNIKDANLIYPGQTIVIPVAVSFAPSRTTPFFYVVGAGESANTIAAKFEMGFETLTKANPGATFAAGSTVLVPAGPHVYTVKQGDELRDIAKLYGTTVEFLLTGNSIPNPDRIYPGQQIFIPIQYNAVPKPF